MRRAPSTARRRAKTLVIYLVLALAVALGVAVSAFAAAGGAPSVNWRNEGYRAGTGWTTGEIGPYNEGDLVPFRLTITNPSSSKTAVVGGFALQVTRRAHDVVVFDYTTGWSGPVSPSSQDGLFGDMLRTTFPAGLTLAPGASATFSFYGHLALSTPSAPAAGLLNGNGVVGFSEVDGDGVGTFGKRVPVKVNARQGTLGTPAIDLVESSNAPTTGVAAGTKVTYTYKVTNIGDIALSNAVITDGVFGHVGTIAGPLAPGASQSLTFDAVLTETTEDTSSVTASDQYGRTATDATKCSVAVVSSARLFGSAYDDADMNGVWDAGEPSIAGWPMQLLDASGNVVAATFTAGDGSYSFDALDPGVTYTVAAAPMDGFGISAPVEGMFMETLTPGQNAGPFDFGILHMSYQ